MHRKHPSWEAGFLIILAVFSIFGLGFISGERIGMNQITGTVVGVTGMDISTPTTTTQTTPEPEPTAPVTTTPTYKAEITTTGQDGKTAKTVVDLGTSDLNEAKEKVKKYDALPGVSISAPYISTSLTVPSDVYEVKNIGTEENPTWIVIGSSNTWLPKDPADKTSADSLADYLKIKEPAIKEGYRESDFYPDDDAGIPLFTKDGITFYKDPIGSPNDPHEGQLFKSYEIGSNKIKVIETYSKQAKDMPKFESATIEGTTIHDKATLNEIKASVGSKGTVSKEGSMIVIKQDNQPFQAFEIIGYDPSTKQGSKGIINYDNAYKDNEGKIISEREYNALSEEEKAGYSLTQVVVSVKGERWIYGEHHSLIADSKIRDGKIVLEGQEFNENGDLVGFYYREGWTYDNPGIQIMLDKDGNTIDEFGSKITYTENDPRNQLLAEAQKRLTQAKSRQWFADFEFRLMQYRGLSGWSQLIFSDDELARWREGVDEIFSSLYLGTEYWASGICSRYIPKEQKGTLTMKTKDGLFDVVAHVEGEKTIMPGPEETKYLYKLTFSVRNPKYSRYDKLKFNVYLYGEQTVKLYQQDIEVSDGDDFTRGSGKREDGQTTYDKEHGKPIVQYSNYNYNKICIRFSNDIINAKGRSENEVCNRIVEYKGEPTKYEQKVTSTAGITQTTPVELYQEADF